MEKSEGLNPGGSQGYVEVHSVEARSLALASQLAMYRHGASEQQTLQWIGRSYSVIQDLQAIDMGLSEAESALRMYSSAHDARAASMFSDALERIRLGFLRAQTSTWDEAAQRQTLRELAPRIAAQVEGLSSSFDGKLSELPTTVAPAWASRSTNRASPARSRSCSAKPMPRCTATSNAPRACSPRSRWRRRANCASWYTSD